MVRRVILLYLLINTMSSLIFKPSWVN
jgi:redox-sensitive bicupin YhaK (pirin superfamily)